MKKLFIISVLTSVLGVNAIADTSINDSKTAVENTLVVSTTVDKTASNSLTEKTLSMLKKNNQVTLDKTSNPQSGQIQSIIFQHNAMVKSKQPNMLANNSTASQNQTNQNNTRAQTPQKNTGAISDKTEPVSENEHSDLIPLGLIALGGTATAVGTTAAITGGTVGLAGMAGGIGAGALLGGAAAALSPLTAVGAVGAGIGIGTSALVAGTGIGSLVGGTATGVLSSLGLISTAPVWAVPVAIAGGITLVGGGAYYLWDHYYHNDEDKKITTEVTEKKLMPPPYSPKTSKWERFKDAVGGTIYEVFH